MREHDCWCVAVLKCDSDKAKDVLIQVSDFVDGMAGVKDFHFIIRDRLEDKVIFSFRLLVEKDQRIAVESKVRYKLKTLVSEDDFAVDPEEDIPLHKYVRWPWEETTEDRGTEKSADLCRFLGQLSRTVVEMAKKDYFGGEERVGLAHAMSWMLGCTEYGLVSTEEMQTGYYDRITDKYHTYKRKRFGTDGSKSR
jgi:hypothetical protein